MKVESQWEMMICCCSVGISYIYNILYMFDALLHFNGNCVKKDVFRTSHTHKGRKHGKNMISTKLRMQWKMLERTSNVAVETPP